jgi:hypothetical protein
MRLPAVNAHEDAIIRVAALTAEAMAMNEAVLSSDLDEATFRAKLIATGARSAGYTAVALASDAVAMRIKLHIAGSGMRFGEALVLLALELERINPSR